MASAPAAKTTSPPKGPAPQEIVRRIGETNEAALAYVLSPDPKLSRLSRKVREALLPELAPVVAGALLGPAALARHFIASAASGRYRDLFFLWDLFRQRPEECKPVLAERQAALERGRDRLRTAVRLGLTGQAERLAEDVQRAEGLIWQWLREPLVENLQLVGLRPAVAAALLEREPDLEIAYPDEPDERWLDEAAAARRHRPLPKALDDLLARNVDHLPATVATLGMAHDHYPDRVVTLLERVDLEGPEIGSILAWARDHGYADQLHDRIRRQVEEAAQGPRAEGLAVWHAWRQRGVELSLPAQLRVPSLEGLDLTRPESAILIAALLEEGADLQPQAALEELARENRQLGEKAYEAFVCADLPVTLPELLHSNAMVKDGTRCPACEAWTWVRPGHERRCPRLAALPPQEPPAPAAPAAEHSVADDFEAAAAAEAAPQPSAEPAPSRQAEDAAPQAAPPLAAQADPEPAAPPEPGRQEATPQPPPAPEPAPEAAPSIADQADALRQAEADHALPPQEAERPGEEPPAPPPPDTGT